MRILIVDDHPILCDAFKNHLERVGPQVSDTSLIVTSVLNFDDAIRAIEVVDNRPDLVFLDLNLDGEHRGAGTLERFQERNSHRVPVVIFTGLSLSDPGTTEILRRCINELGAQTVLSKGTDLNTMFIGLPRILAFERWLSNELFTALLATRNTTTTENALDLTPRQWDVARLLTRGQRNKEIARQLNLSPGNVQQITGAIYKRLGVHSRLEATIVIQESDSGRAQLDR